MTPAADPPRAAQGRDWVAALRGSAAAREAALADLRSLLLRGARFELARRRHLLRQLPHDELEGLAVEAVDEAIATILETLDSFRGASRFTTWAYKFVLVETGVRAQRRAWHGHEISMSIDVIETPRPIRALVQASLTPHQREVFVALALNGVPIDVLAERLNTTRGALYGTLRDARCRLRAVMAETGLTCAV